MSDILTEIIDSASDKWWGRLTTSGTATREIMTDTKSIVKNHFENFSSLNHPCRETLSSGLSLLEKKSALIIETGTAAYGSNSTILFDSYVSSFGGEVITVDNRITPLMKIKDYCSNKTTFYLNDSVNFINQISEKGLKADLIYLDSWDLDLRSPMDSALHGLREFLACIPIIKTGTILLIDDTPSSLAAWVIAQGDTQTDLYLAALNKYKIHPGKGALVKQYVESLELGDLVQHQYQLLFRMR